jgi:predicted DNA-binding protein (MmcQ/YjbR family)
VQAQVAAEVLSVIGKGRGVVLELILYKAPPNPLTAYQDLLADDGIGFATVVLEPTVDEVLERLQRRGRPNDLAALDARRTDAERQVEVLATVDRASRIEVAGMTVDALCDEVVARLAAAEGLDPADLPELERIRAICLGFDGAEEAILQDRPLFRVGRRRFALFNGSGSPPRPRWSGSGRSLHFLADPDERAALREDDRFSPSPHHGDRGWMSLRFDAGAGVDWVEIAELLESAHRQVCRRGAG